ncbi:MAG: accessory factor UbiK family protein [Neisseriaceae bacterium]|nr:accessory factor UbiK family protein [Neisseriaceae bacterium]
MNAKQILDELGQKISQTVANSPVKDIEKNAKAMFSGALNKMDLVTREEFDVQQQVLVKTRMKLNELEERFAALEARLNGETESTNSDNSEQEQVE